SPNTLSLEGSPKRIIAPRGRPTSRVRGGGRHVNIPGQVAVDASPTGVIDTRHDSEDSSAPPEAKMVKLELPQISSSWLEKETKCIITHPHKSPPSVSDKNLNENSEPSLPDQTSLSVDPMATDSLDSPQENENIMSIPGQFDVPFKPEHHITLTESPLNGTKPEISEPGVDTL
ncbi:unnamed protein product, partial [Protopolystoma xenopodis]